MGKNALKKEKSPYLRQHQDDPVHWYTWGSEAFKEAKASNKPILLSVGYSACHWCHVMAAESFSDPQTAELMNRFFVNIKVDKEERPDVDALYQEALHMFGGQGGWPLTMFLTPDSKPFFGGTYFPAEQKNGLPSFREVLWQLANMWRQNPTEALSRSKEAYENLKTLAASNAGRDDLPQEKIDELANDLLPFIDPDNGGFGQGAKFPHNTALDLMWQSWRHGKDDKKERRLLAAGVRLSVDRMCQGGLFDHLRGGFYRYCVDREWQTPHFEKMLTDNAQMLQTLTAVWCETKNPLYKHRVEKTAGWMLDEMRTETGGFATALDADTAEGEGRFYLWTPEEIRGALGKDAEKLMSAYGVNKDDNTPQHLNRGHVTAWDDEVDGDMATLRENLLKVQSKRQCPNRDDKVLADGNGLAIAALARAGMVFDKPEWLKAAQDAFEFICKNHSGKEGALYHSWCDGDVKKVSFAEDYTAMAHGALALYEATGEKHFLEKSQGWMYRLMERHEDAQKGGFYRTQKDNHDLLVPLKSSRDSATPSANGLAMQVLARLFHLTGSRVWQEQAMRVFGAFSGDIIEELFAYTSLLFGQSLLINPTTITIVGDKKSKTFKELEQAAWLAPVVNKVVLPLSAEETQSLPHTHPAYGKAGAEEAEKPTAYICKGASCLAPIHKPDALLKALQ